jgi:hypothetical protein
VVLLFNLKCCVPYYHMRNNKFFMFVNQLSFFLTKFCTVLSTSNIYYAINWWAQYWNFIIFVMDFIREIRLYYDYFIIYPLQ